MRMPALNLCSNQIGSNAENSSPTSEGHLRQRAHTAGHRTLTNIRVPGMQITHIQLYAAWQMSRCSPAGSRLTKSPLLLLLQSPRLLSLPPCPTIARVCTSLWYRDEKTPRREGQAGRWHFVSDELAGQPLLPPDMCYLSIAQGEDYQALARSSRKPSSVQSATWH